MSDEKPFVNRRGRQVLTTEVLGSIKLDDEPEEQVSHEVVQSAAKDRKKRSFRLKRWQKLTLLIFVLLLIGLPLAVGEYLRADYASSAIGAKTLVHSLADGQAKVQQQTTDLTAADMSLVVDQVTTIRDAMCKGEFFDNLADLYPRAKSALEQCAVTREKANSIAAGLGALQQQKAYLEQLQHILEPLALDNEGAFANFTVQQEKWVVAADQIKQLTPPASFRAAHEKLSTTSRKVADTWIQLNNANTAENQTDFQAAEVQLAAQYEAFRLLSSDFEAVIAAAQSKVSRAYQEL